METVTLFALILFAVIYIVMMAFQKIRPHAAVISALSPNCQNLTKATEAAKVSADRLVPSVVAAAKAVLSERQRENGVAVVDFGATTTGVAIYEEGELQYVGVVPAGSNNITNDLAIDTPPYLGGGYTEVNYTPLANLIKIPESVDPVTAAVCACPGPTIFHSVALAKRAGIDLASMETAVVQGLGPVGCFAVAYLHAIGVKRVIAICAGDNPERNALVKALGADEIFSFATISKEDAAQAILDMTGGMGADVCFECSGAPDALPFGMEILRLRGVYLIPGQYSNSGTVAISPETITFKALQILGSSQYSFPDVREYVAFLEANPETAEKIGALATKYPVREVNRAFDDMGKRRNIKTLLVP